MVARCTNIAMGCFLKNLLGDVKIKRLPPFLPPFPGGDLLGENFDIPIRPRRQQARNGGFDIDGRFLLTAGLLGMLAWG